MADFCGIAWSRTVRGIGLYMNSNETCFNQDGAISSLNGMSLKLVDHFIYLGSNISSTESNVNIRVEKAWIAIDKLSIISKSDLTDKIKWEFFQAIAVFVLLYGCTT